MRSISVYVIEGMMLDGMVMMGVRKRKERKGFEKKKKKNWRHDLLQSWDCARDVIQNQNEKRVAQAPAAWL